LVEDIFAMSTIPVPVDIEDTGLEKYGAQVLEKAKTIAIDAGATDLSDKILRDDPAMAILDYSEEVDADMIIIRTREMGDFSCLMLRSASHKVAHDAKCTCITVK
jgi:nucleotide-binding universal stress UspA family protein